MKRDLVAEILERKGRAFRASRPLEAFISRAKSIVPSIEHLKTLTKDVPLRDELARYIPVAAVASLESFYRLWIATLIDSGNPFLARITEYRDVRFHPEGIIAFHSRSLTIGEYVAHQLTYSKFASADAIFGPLLYPTEARTSFLDEVITKAVKGEFDDEPHVLEEEMPEVRRQMSAVYDARNIVCHEIPNASPADFSRLVSYFANTIMFVFSCDAYLSNEIKKDEH